MVFFARFFASLLGEPNGLFVAVVFGVDALTFCPFLKSVLEVTTVGVLEYNEYGGCGGGWPLPGGGGGYE